MAAISGERVITGFTAILAGRRRACVPTLDTLGWLFRYKQYIGRQVGRLFVCDDQWVFCHQLLEHNTAPRRVELDTVRCSLLLSTR